MNDLLTLLSIYEDLKQMKEDDIRDITQDLKDDVGRTDKQENDSNKETC